MIVIGSGPRATDTRHYYNNIILCVSVCVWRVYITYHYYIIIIIWFRGSCAYASEKNYVVTSANYYIAIRAVPIDNNIMKINKNYIIKLLLAFKRSENVRMLYYNTPCYYIICVWAK